jgi:hypothetical protein
VALGGVKAAAMLCSGDPSLLTIASRSLRGELTDSTSTALGGGRDEAALVILFTCLEATSEEPQSTV